MLLDWLKNRKTQELSEPEFIDQNATLRVIGDRGSGKTAYMASLSHWPNADANSPVQMVTPISDGYELVDKARNILEQGLELAPSDLDPTADTVKDYGLSITLKGQFQWKNPKLGLRPQMVKLNVNCKDYAGEFFSDLVHKTGDSRLESYLEDCLQATGLLFLVDGTAYRKDRDYAHALEKFLMALDRTDLAGQKRRIALVLSKCEQEELWVSRHQPRELAKRRFGDVYTKLESWSKIGAGQVDYFVTSAFGVLGSRFPQANAVRRNRDRNGTTSVIKDPKRWRPFGLVAPIYWLCTGERHKELDKG